MNIINQITAQAETVEGVKLLDVDPGAATNRTVVTLVGTPDQVMEAAFRCIKKAKELIDMYGIASPIFMTFYSKMIVRLPGEHTVSAVGFQNTLSKNNACRDIIFFHFPDSTMLIHGIPKRLTAAVILSC